jgi:hypothetical protein
MPAPRRQPERQRLDWGHAVGTWAFLATAVALIGVPMAAVGWRLVTQDSIPLPSNASKSLLFLLLRSIASAGGVAILAMIMAVGPAWYVRSKGWRAVPLLLVPMVAPSYLAYSGWQLLRSPGTWLGDWLESQTANNEIVAVIIGRSFAFGGLALWSWPLAMLLLVPAFRAIPDATLQAMDLDGVSRARKVVEVGRMARRGLAAAWIGVTLVMLGSAVPFHLVLLPTFAIDVWMTLIERPGDLGVWLRAWPVVAIAFGAAGMLGRWSSRRHDSADESTDVTACQASTWASLWTAAAWCLSVVAPLALFAGHLHSWSSIPKFIRTTSQAIVQNGVVAGIVGLGVAILMVLAWSAAVSWRGGRVGLAVGLGLLAAGVLVPGILVGAGVLQGIEVGGRLLPGLQDLRDGIGGLVWGHVARFGGIGALAGVVLGLAEGREARELRAIDGCGWWRTVSEGLLKPWGGVVVAVGVAGGLLSMFEIEATILLVPPGPGSLSHTILGFLHFAKDEQLCAAGVAIIGGGVVIASVAAGLARVSLRNR